jgi:hypothetical protein
VRRPVDIFNWIQQFPRISQHFHNISHGSQPSKKNAQLSWFPPRHSARASTVQSSEGSWRLGWPPVDLQNLGAAVGSLMVNDDNLN